jgi:predicted hydrolase (HD superfamily)
LKGVVFLIFFCYDLSIQKFKINIMIRNEAYEILKQNVLENNLIKHCLSVEVGMRKLAEYFKEDVEK